jgi:hypothetical protein
MVAIGPSDNSFEHAKDCLKRAVHIFDKDSTPASQHASMLVERALELLEPLASHDLPFSNAATRAALRGVARENVDLIVNELERNPIHAGCLSLLWKRTHSGGGRRQAMSVAELAENLNSSSPGLGQHLSVLAGQSGGERGRIFREYPMIIRQNLEGRPHYILSDLAMALFDIKAIQQQEDAQT